MTPLDTLLAKRLLQTLPEHIVSSLDPSKLQILRISGAAASALLLFVGLAYSNLVAFLASLLFVSTFCLLREMAIVAKMQLPPEHPLLIFGDAGCWLLFFTGIGFHQMIAAQNILILIAGFVVGILAAALPIANFILQKKLKDSNLGDTVPSWTFYGYTLDDLMYLMPIFAIIAQVKMFLLITLVVLLGANIVMLYGYYRRMTTTDSD